MALGMQLQGSCLSLPVRPDQRGTLSTLSDRVKIVEQSIVSILRTRQGERVMLPDYGLPDYVFSVLDAGFVPRLSYFLKQQIARYEPLARGLRVTLGAFRDGTFQSGFTADQGRAAIMIEFSVRGSNVPYNLVYPTRKLVAFASA
ncbi:MAG: GPW/gp25 family protein [Pyrinomonadaceae bacterium]